MSSLQIFFPSGWAGSLWFLRPSPSSCSSAPTAQTLPKSLAVAEFVFVCDDSSNPPLSPLYRGLYKVMHLGGTFVVIQIREKSNSVSVDCSKPVISSSPLTLAKARPCRHPRLHPTSISLHPDPVCLQKKRMCFLVQVPPATQLCWNPCRMFWGPPPSSALTFWFRPLEYRATQDLFSGIGLSNSTIKRLIALSCLIYCKM